MFLGMRGDQAAHERTASDRARFGGAGLSVARALGKVVVTVRGRLDATRTPLLGKLVEELSSGDCQLDMAVDLRHVAPIDDETINVLVGVSREIHDRGGTLVVGGVAPEVGEVLSRRGLLLSPSDRGRARVQVAQGGVR